MIRTTQRRSKRAEAITESDLAITTLKPDMSTRLRIALVALAAAVLAMLPALIALPSLRATLAGIAHHPAGIAHVAPVFWLDLFLLILPAVGAYLLIGYLARLIVLVRGWQGYLAAMGRDLAGRLAEQATLSALGYVPMARGGAGMACGEQACRLLPLFTRALLTGEDGSGKTIVLWRYALEVTRHASVWNILAGKQVLPILVSLPAYMQSDPAPQGWRTRHLATLMRGYDAGVLARYLPSLLRRGRVLLLCDGLDALPEPQMRVVMQEWQTALSQRYRATRVILTCRTANLEMLQAVPLMQTFTPVTLAPLAPDDIQTILRRAERAGKLGGQLAPHVWEDLERRALIPLYASPALLAMLLELMQSGAFIPNTRAHLLSEYEEVLFARAGIHDAQMDAVREALGYLAIAFHVTGLAEISAAQAWNERETVQSLLSDTSAATVALGTATPPLKLSEAALAAALEKGRKAGVVERGFYGIGLRFHQRLLLDLAAARHLDRHDAGLGRLAPVLLHPDWADVVILWGGLTNDPAGLVERLARESATPGGTTHPRIETPDRNVAFTLALALTVAVVSLTLPATSSTTAPEPESRADWAQHTLRETFDRVLRFGAEDLADRRERLRAALRMCEARAGGECTARLAQLVRTNGVQRLLRAQAVQVLGLLASPESLNALTRLLLEPDPVVREALQRGFHLAGVEAAAPLLDLLARADASQSLHRRALEALTAIDGPAVEPALARMQSGAPSMRAAAVEGLGALRDRRAMEPVLAALHDGDPTVRLAATRALGRLGDVAALDALLGMVHAPAEEQRVAAAEALGALRDARAIKSLIALLDDKQPRVRAAAAEALGRLGDARAVEALRRHLADKDAWAQAAAATALRALGQRT